MSDPHRHGCPACGEGFETLSAKRLHDCPEEQPPGPEEWDERDVSGKNIDAIVDETTDAILKCVHCGRQNDEIHGGVDAEYGPGGVVVVAEFDCEKCGGHQRNTAELS